VTASERGFSILELLTATAIVLAATAGAFTLVIPSHGTFAAQSEAADMQQRVRVAADTLSRELLAAAAPSASVAPVRPYRAGPVRADPPGTFKSGTITVFSLPAAPGPLTSATYWQQDDTASGTYQLMFYDGSPAGADVPALDHVVSLAFEYYGTNGGGDPSLTRLTPAELTDGPWYPDAAAVDRWDADLLRIRRVAVSLRVEAAAGSLRGPASALFAHGGTSRRGHSWVPDIEVRFDVSPRNLNLGR
jgi:type II secretory pathway pseudopilin PulG